MVRSEASKGKAASSLAGINRSHIRRPDWFRFCPSCVEEDAKSFGESYWHRLHQIPGVETCPKHEVFLENSSAGARNRKNPSEYLPAEQVISKCHPLRPLNLSDTFQQILLNIARDAAWLLSERGKGITAELTRKRYTELLRDHGFASVSGIVYCRRLLKALKDHYTDEVLNKLRCGFNETSTSWPAQIVSALNRDIVHHPLRHLLLIQFLGCTAETFYEAGGNSKPFGDGPWPCLNPVCRHHLKPSIRQIQFVYKTVQTRRVVLPVATFSCSCGFVYARTGPDVKPQDRQRITRIITRGSGWDAALKKLWYDLSLSITEIRRQLKCGRSEIKHEAARLGLKFPRQGPSGPAVQKPEELPPSSSKAKSPTQEELLQSRKLWESALKGHPELSRTELYKKFFQLHQTLYYHDRDWLEAHLPQPRQPGGNTSSVDWSSRDVALAKAVKQSARRMRSVTGRPVRVTKTGIARDINEVSSLLHRLDKLPQTEKALSEVVETRVQFAKRRLRWAADCYRQENILPTRTALAIRASFGCDIWDVPEVKDAIEATLRSLELEMRYQRVDNLKELKVA
jgi:hypothetical protein